MIAGLVLGLYIWSFTARVSHIGGSFDISNLTAGLATVTVLLALISYFFAPPALKTLTAYCAYLLLVATVAVLVLQTGQNNSPFIALWMITAVFGGMFGIGTLTILLAGAASYVVWLIIAQTLTKEAILSVILAGILPVFISYVLWHSNSKGEKSKDRAYYDLANELHQVSNKAEVVINAIGDGVIAIDNQGVIELINPAAQRICGWGRQDAIGLDYKSVLQLLGHDGHEVTKGTDPVFEVLTTNQQKRANDLILQTNAGKRLSVSVVASPIGHLGSGAIVVFRDITKELAEEHEQAEFISTASHEMRTPVASIEGYLGLALNPATATIDSKARDFIGKAHEAAQHLGRLFQDLLDVSKADDGRMSNNPKVINVVDFMQSIIDELKPKADQKSLRLFFKQATVEGRQSTGLQTVTPVFFLHLDADHLREILSNLVENAIKYTPAGEVVIDVNGDEEHVVISITDSGIGIPSEDIPHLFQKFYRVDNSDTREIGGTGLGLYLCRRLVEAMNGRIWVESEYKHGSTFFVEVPRISHEEANRLIEAASNEPDLGDKNYIREGDLSENAKEHESIMDTPVILNHAPRLTDPEEAISQEERESAGGHAQALVPPATPTPLPVAAAPAPAPVPQPAPIAVAPAAPAATPRPTPVARPAIVPARPQPAPTQPISPVPK